MYWTLELGGEICCRARAPGRLRARDKAPEYRVNANKNAKRSNQYQYRYQYQYPYGTPKTNAGRRDAIYLCRMQHADKKKQTGSQREQKIKIREGRKINQIKSNRTRHINREPSIIYTHIPSSSCLVFCAYIVVYIIYTRRNGFGAFVCPGAFQETNEPWRLSTAYCWYLIMFFFFFFFPF